MQPVNELDAVCGMMVDPSKAATSIEHQGTTFYFCSQSCAAKFREAPEKYALIKPVEAPVYASAKTQDEYPCPMHPEIKQTGPGRCPKYGIALEPVTVSASPKNTEYTCPMHPQIVRPGPGSCPICGMALEPREITAEESNSELTDMTKRLWFSVVLASRSGRYWHCDGNWNRCGDGSWWHHPFEG